MWATAIGQRLKGVLDVLAGIGDGDRRRPSHRLAAVRARKPNAIASSRCLKWLAGRSRSSLIHHAVLQRRGLGRPHSAGPGAQDAGGGRGTRRHGGPPGRRVAASLGLLEQTTIMAVSDHGMSQQAPDRKVFFSTTTST
jgi:hypothetical protein